MLSMTEGARSPDIGQLGDWLNAARLRPAAQDEISLGNLDKADVSIVAADLEGIAAAAESMTVQLQQCLDAEPSGDVFESRLIDLEISLRHANWHWDSLVVTLGRRELWPDDDDS